MKERPIYYSGGGLERAAPLRRDPAGLAQLAGQAQALLLPVWKGKNLLAPGPSPRAVMLPAAGLREAMAAAVETVFLGLMDGKPLFASDLSEFAPGEEGPNLGSGTAFVSLREVGPLLPAREASLLAYARGLLYWHTRSRFCGVCGQPTVAEEGGHSRRCSGRECATQHFPRTDPAVIMLVEDPEGERVLLARQPRFPAGMFSTLAGFVEPGESLEEAVIREVAEEVGLKAAEVSYIASQPWPFPSSLMLGFLARAKTVEIQRDAHELEDARWFSRADIAGFESKGMFLPRADSIARHLIDGWLAARKPRPRSRQG
jgi:NAD+ diphosphatase